MRSHGLTLRAVLLLAATMGLAACHDSDDNGPDGPPAPMTPGDTWVLTNSAAGQRLLSFNRATPGSIRTAMPVTGLAGGERIVGADFRPADGNLYAVTSNSRVVRLDPATAVASAPVALSTPLDTTLSATFGVDFNPVPDRLRVVNSNGQNLRINVADGATTVDGTLKQDRRTGGDISGISGAAYTMSFPQACRTTLYYLNSSSGMLMTSADPNGGTLFNVGSLGVATPAAINGFDVLTGTAGDGLPTNTGVAVISSGAGAPTLHTIDLTTGVATAAGAIGVTAGEQVVSLLTPLVASPTRQARGELVALMTGATGDKLASFNRGSPAKLCTGPTPVTGLGGENIVGIDTRPATGELYAVTSGSRLMTLNPDTAAATLKVAMGTALPGGVVAFGVDFNPVPDRLRITAANGVNLRVHPVTGVVITDTALSANDVSGAAYTNSLRSAAEDTASGGSTTLFAINHATDSLVRIGSDPANGTAGDPGNPNSGVVNNVGALGVLIESTNAFEIDGLNGEALLAAFSAGSTSSQLYRVNLATGAAALVTAAAASSTIGGATGEHVRGMALVPTAAPGPAVTVFALLDNGTDLVSFLPSAAATPSAATAITGLAGGETLLDIDFRVTGNSQRNRQLVGVSDQNRLYVINPATGAATGGRVLRNSTGGANVIVNGSTAMDFNPVPDLLRLISSTGQNLRINPDVDNGVNVDTALTGATTGLVGVAYANNFVSTTATTLFGIDAATASLVRIGSDPASSTAGDPGNPNSGVVTFIGALGALAPPLGSAGDMEIVGGRNGYALAAVVPLAGGTSTLLRINLATGAATSLGNIATGGAVRSIAVRVQ